MENIQFHPNGVIIPPIHDQIITTRPTSFREVLALNHREAPKVFCCSTLADINFTGRVIDDAKLVSFLQWAISLPLLESSQKTELKRLPSAAEWFVYVQQRKGKPGEGLSISTSCFASVDKSYVKSDQFQEYQMPVSSLCSQTKVLKCMAHNIGITINLCKNPVLSQQHHWLSNTERNTTKAQLEVEATKMDRKERQAIRQKLDRQLSTILLRLGALDFGDKECQDVKMKEMDKEVLESVEGKGERGAPVARKADSVLASPLEPFEFELCDG